MSVEEATISGPWIERLAHHIMVEEYSLPTTQKRLAVARRFLHYLGKQGVDVVAAATAHEKAFLIHRLKAYRKRHGREPNDLSGWRWGQTSGIHMVMRVAQGLWPPVTIPSSPEDAFRLNLCDAYARWLSDTRGLAATTIPNRRAEARRFLESLGDRGGEQALLAHITVADLDHYLTKRAPSCK